MSAENQGWEKSPESKNQPVDFSKLNLVVLSKDGTPDHAGVWSSTKANVDNILPNLEIHDGKNQVHGYELVLDKQGLAHTEDGKVAFAKRKSETNRFSYKADGSIDTINSTDDQGNLISIQQNKDGSFTLTKSTVGTADAEGEVKEQYPVDNVVVNEDGSFSYHRIQKPGNKLS